MLELARRVCAPLVRTRAPSGHATSLSKQTERRLPSARRNCRLRGGTAECAEELGKLINSKHGAPAERERSRCEAEAAAGAGPSA